jgi:hypothetical protein
VVVGESSSLVVNRQVGDGGAQRLPRRVRLRQLQWSRYVRAMKLLSVCMPSSVTLRQTLRLRVERAVRLLTCMSRLS